MPRDAVGHLLPASSQHLPSVCVCVRISSSYKDTGDTGLGSMPMTSFNLNSFLKTLPPNVVILSGVYELGGGGDILQPITVAPKGLLS